MICVIRMNNVLGFLMKEQTMIKAIYLMNCKVISLLLKLDSKLSKKYVPQPFEDVAVALNNMSKE